MAVGACWRCSLVVLFAIAINLSSVKATEIQAKPHNLPNIVLILADDLGYGDLSCLNPESKIQTPNLDRLAREGMIFTDAHTPSSVCTPTRYGLLTGRYAWRTRLQSGVLLGFDRPLIEPNRLTLASLLKSRGYRTAAVGKWHLGLGWQSSEGKPVTDQDNTTDDPGVDYTRPITEGPLTVGFDYFFGIAASLDMAPYCYIENDRVTQIPQEDTKGQAFPANWRPGKKSADFAHEQVLSVCTAKANAWLKQEHQSNPDRPLFLYVPLSAPHTPVLPLPEFKGKSQAGDYGDFVVQVDHAVGEILKTIDGLGIRDNTLVIFTSDNGSTMTIRPFFQQYQHATNYHFRGQKSDIWEGGHRVPFLVRWPGHVPTGSVCDQPICLTDILATVADIISVPLPNDAGEDSFSFFRQLGNPEVPLQRPPIVMHSGSGLFAIREGDWKLLECRGSGGWSLPEQKVPANAPPKQLYNLKDDVGEQNNLFLKRPEVAQRLSELLEKIRTAGPRSAAAKPQLGMNLAGPADWNTELPFVDVFRLSRPWISQQAGQPWGQGPTLELDEHGWVKRLASGCYAETLMCTIDGGHYPSGQYTVLYEGQGELDAGGAAKVVSRQPGRLILEVDSSKGAIFLRLRETNPENYVRNIRVIMPGFESTYEAEPFHPEFLARWQGVACFRFMDWMETNNSKITKWSERPTLASATFSQRGIPLEWMIALCNRQKADAWFCMPHLADDDYVRNFAKMVKEKLDPSLKVYVEYSNEVWNGMFQQSRWAGQEGVRLGFAEKPWEAAWRFTAHRSVQIFRIWEEVFGGRDRLVRVLPTQAANPYVSEQIVKFQDAYKHADALAIAPYISFNVPAKGDKLTADLVATWTVDQLLDHIERESLPKAINWIQSQKEIADRFGLKLVAYEGGQHLVGVGGGENNEALTALLQAANRHPRMAAIYEKYYQAWEDAGGGLFCYFSSVSGWSKWGSWGILEYFDDDPKSSPKFLATMKWAKKLGQPVRLP